MATLHSSDNPSDFAVQFRRLVAELPSTPEPPYDLYQQYDHYALESTHSMWSSAAIEDHLKKCVSQAFEVENQNKTTLSMIFGELYLRTHLINEDNQITLEYLTALSFFGFMFEEPAPFECTEIWTNALLAIRDLMRLRLRREGHTDFDLGSRWFGQLITSTRALLDSGFECVLQGTRIELSEVGEQRLNYELTRQMAQIGGLNYLEHVFRRYQERGLYDQHFDRYWLRRENKDHGMTHIPSEPFGLLLQLAVQDGRYYRFSAKNFSAAVEKLNKISLHFGVIAGIDAQVGIQSTSAWTNVIQSIYNYLVYNTVFLPDQTRPAHAARILKGLYSSFDDTTLRERQGWGLANLLQITKLLEVCKSGVEIIAVEVLRRECPALTEEGWNNLIHAVSHKQGQINSRHCAFQAIMSRDNYSRINFYKKPLIRLDKGNLALAGASFCIDSVNHVMFAALRSNGFSPNDVLSKMGHTLEQFVVDLFSQNGFSMIVGTHEHGTGETDLLLESEKTVFLFEVKKTYRAQPTSWGHHVSMLEDLTKGLARSQAQMLRAERALRSENGLKFIKPNRVTVHLAERRLLRITLTLHDFGALHHPLNARHCVMALAGAQFETTTNDFENQIKGINSFTRKLGEEMRLTAETLLREESITHEEWERRKFKILERETFFISLQQLMTILDHCKNIEDFERELFRLDNISLGTHDLLLEWAYLRR